MVERKVDEITGWKERMKVCRRDSKGSFLHRVGWNPLADFNRAISNRENSNREKERRVSAANPIKSRPNLVMSPFAIITLL